MSNTTSSSTTPSPPLDCYRVIVCAAAICDQATNLLSFINVHEAWQFSAEMFGKNIPVQAHFALHGGGDYEVRLTWVNAEDKTEPASDTTDTVVIDGRQRFCSPQVKIPATPGSYSLILEWRRQSSHRWERGAARAPIDIQCSNPVELAPKLH